MYKKRKKRDNKKIYIISALIAFFIIGFICNVVLTDRNLTIFEKAIKDSVLTVEKVLSYPIEFVSNKIEERNEKNKMYDEYKNLKQQLEDMKEIATLNDELKKQLEELKSILDVNEDLSSYVKVNATVINRDINYWQETITIDKGEQDGVVVGSPVVVSDGLIGKVVKTSNFNSTVRLLTSDNESDKISVKIKNGDDYIYGILSKYNSNDDTYTIEGISQNAKILVGSTVTTTGMGDIFPAGILIGKITGSTTDVFDLANVLEMKSEVDFNNINYVTVLKRNI